LNSYKQKILTLKDIIIAEEERQSEKDIEGERKIK
jgi:hypothetical protein